MLDSTLEPPSSTLDDQPQDWNDVFLNDSQNIVISFPPDVIQDNSSLYESSPFDDAVQDMVDNDVGNKMDWANEELYTPFQAGSWDSDGLEDIDGSMTCLEKLQMFSNSNRIQHRIMVASELLPSLETITNVQDAIQYFLPIFHKVATDPDHSVREILANDIGEIVLYFFKHAPPALRSTRRPSSSSSSSSVSSNTPITHSAYSAIPSHFFSFTLIELLLDQNATISSLCQRGIVAVSEYLTSAASSLNDTKTLEILDQEIVQGVIMKLYSIVEGKEQRNMQQRTFISTNTMTESSADLPYIDHGELHLSKMACLSLISALAQFLGPECCTIDCLPIIENLTKDGLFYVRKEAVLALGNIVHCVDPTIAANRLIPLYNYFIDDPTWHVRNSCIMILPALCGAVPYEEKCQLAITSVNIFTNDSSPTVRFTLAEVIGKVIAKFLPCDWETTGLPGNVPVSIVNFFLSLGDNTNHQPTQHPIENDCTLVCAHNFPAVLLTAGAIHWDSLFRERYLRLAKDHQVETRSSFAHSLHVIAKIIGPTRTVNDLVHIFALYLMDVDQVKSGVMEHLASFLEAMDGKDRCEYLPVLMEIWEGAATSRPFRETLVCQLIYITPLCTLDQFVEHILPLVLCACQDEVAIIRDTGGKVFPAVLELLKKESAQRSGSSIIQIVNGLQLLVESPGYRQRLLFANIAHTLLLNGLSFHGFVTYLLDLLLCLVYDNVINVRIAASRCLATLFCKVSISHVHSQQQLVLYHQKLNTALKKLYLDQDIDICLYMDVVTKQIESMTSTPSLLKTAATYDDHHSQQYQHQNQNQIEDILTELPSPPSSPNEKQLPASSSV